MDRSRLAIVIPAYNEEKTISSVVKGVVPFGMPIVVDDGSKDGTACIAASEGAVVVSHEQNRGYDEALNSGFEKAFQLEVEIVMTFDADGQHSSELIDQFLVAIDGGADVVIGNRNRRARFTEVIFSWVARKLWQIEDPLCGMKAYRIEVYKALGHFDSYESIGSELCIFAAKKNRPIAQVSFEVKDRSDLPRLGNLWSSNLKIIRALLLGILRQQKH
ncbi:glycosyltransferase family 2 protein [bacterium]|nr:glycosyltransferase family 2 protein [bacterium]